MSNWEEALLGTILNDPACLRSCEDLLPSDFTGPNQTTFAEILSLNQRNSVGPRALSEVLATSPDFSSYANVGTPDEFIANLMYYRGSEPEEYIRQVLDASIRRAIRRNAALIAAEADGNRKTSQELLDYAEERVMSLRRNRNGGASSIGDILAVFMPRLDGMLRGTFSPAWKASVGAMREVLDYAEASDAICYAGRPGDGKSSLLRYDMYRQAKDGGRRVAIINLENDPTDYARGYIALHTGIDSKRIKEPSRLNPDELARVRQASVDLAHMNIFIRTMAAPSVFQVRQTIRRLVSENKIEMVGIDYLQLIKNNQTSTVDDISMTSQQLRASSLELGIPHFNVSQLNRAIETRGQETQDPMLSDLRGSGSIEQDHTAIVFIRNAWRNPSDAEVRQFPENVDENGVTLTRMKAVPVIFHVAKNRNGETGKSGLVKWNKSTGNFQTLVRQ